MRDDFVTKDSGERQAFSTGAQRDIQAGKDRYDLIPTHALRRVAGLYARGAEKYGDNNWQKGIPFSRTLSSLERHLQQWKQGDTPEEDHLAAVCWGILALMHYQEVGRDDLNDLHRGKSCPFDPRLCNTAEDDHEAVKKAVDNMTSSPVDGYSHNDVEAKPANFAWR